MKYQRPKSEDWVELRGAGELSMDELDNLTTEDRKIAQALVLPLVTAAGFHRKGLPVDVLADGLGALTWRQWLWLRDTVFEAVRDDILDPEA